MTQIRVFSRHDYRFDTKKPGDIGHDLYVHVENRTWLERLLSILLNEKIHIVWPVVGSRTVSSGIHVHMDEDVWCEIRPRSSTSRKKLQILGGTIDSGYRGELYSVIHNFGLIPRIIRHGERYAQVAFYQAIRPQIIEVSERSFLTFVEYETEQGGRGFQGFGSTGA